MMHGVRQTMAKALVGSALRRALVPGQFTVPLRAASSFYEDVDVFQGTAEAAQRVLIQGYDETGFHVNGTVHKGAVVCLSSLVLEWSPKSVRDLTPESFSLFQLLRPAPEILVLGCGKSIQRVGEDVKAFLRANGIKLEAVDSRNAASTFNFLNEEGRLVAAALLPTSA